MKEMTTSMLMPMSAAAVGIERERAHRHADARLQHDEAQRDEQQRASRRDDESPDRGR